MNVVLLASVLALALALVLTVQPVAVRAIAGALFVIVVVLTHVIPLPPIPARAIVVGSALTAIVTAATIYRANPRPGTAIPLALLCGMGVGVATSQIGSARDAVQSLPWVLACIPMAMIRRHAGEIALKIAASWVIAIAILSAAVPLLVMVPGYASDHMD